MLRAVDMYPHVKANLRKRYPYDDGWIIRKLDRDKGEPDFLVDRRRKGYVERVVVYVVPDCEITQRHIEELESFAQRYTEGEIRITSKIIVVCKDAKLSQLEGIEIMVLRSCECNR